MLPSFPKTSATRGAGSYRRSAGRRRAVPGWRRPSPALSKRSEGGATPVVMATRRSPRGAPRVMSRFGNSRPSLSNSSRSHPSNPSLSPRESPGTSSAPRAMSRTTSPTSTRPPWRTSPATSWCCTTWRTKTQRFIRARRTPRPSPPSPSASARATWPSRNARRGCHHRVRSHHDDGLAQEARARVHRRRVQGAHPRPEKYPDRPMGAQSPADLSSTPRPLIQPPTSPLHTHTPTQEYVSVAFSPRQVGHRAGRRPEWNVTLWNWEGRSQLACVPAKPLGSDAGAVRQVRFAAHDPVWRRARARASSARSSARNPGSGRSRT